MIAAAVAASGCGDKAKNAATGPGYQSPASTSAGLAFAVVDANYTASTILFNDFATGDLVTLSSGESGDPALRFVDNRLFLFNRTATSLNFRPLDVTNAAAPTGVQLATPMAAVGDPHDVLSLSAERMLLALYSAGKIIVINPKTGVLLQELKADWDLGAGAKAQLRPERFLVRPRDGGQDIYVIHQGLDQAFAADGTQQVFVLRDDGTTLSAVDMDPAKDKVQGIALPQKNASDFYPEGEKAVLIYGECTLFDAPTCQAGFVRFDLTTHAVETVFDTKALGYIGNGGVTPGPAGFYFGLMAKGEGQAPPKFVVKIDYAAKTATEVYQFKGASGCCSLVFDDSTKALFTGDANPADPNAGVLLAFPENHTDPTQVALTGLPYGGLLVPK